jgi:hypothetical protein
MTATGSNLEVKDNLGPLLLEVEQQLMHPVFRKNREQVSSLAGGGFPRVWLFGTPLEPG